MTDFDPSEPTWEDLYGDPDDPDISAELVVEEMKRGGVDLSEHVDSLRQLLDTARVRYFTEYHDWLARSAKEGSQWRPHRYLRKNWDPETPVYDYGELAGQGFEDLNWGEHWSEGHAKPVSKTGKRARNPGTFRGSLPRAPRPLGKPPLVTVYHMVNRWWRTERGEVFRPNFDGVEEGGSFKDNVKILDPTALFLVLVMMEVDYLCTIEHCRRVHTESDQNQDTSLK